MRASGILLPIFSLPSEYGIGCFSKEAFKFVDMLKDAGQKYWQILPIGPTGYGDSPYQSFSTFAGNPYFIDLEELIALGWLTEEECKTTDFSTNERYIDYEKLYLSRFPLLRKAFDKSKIENVKEFIDFCKQNEVWLEDYALYMAIKDSYDGIEWREWDEEIRDRKPESIALYKEQLKDEITFYKFLQFLFYTQWEKLAQYAKKQGIKIIGDIPIYVALDSADCWAKKDLFQFKEEAQPIAVAGCPPDGFSETGQLWGNPLYDWEYHDKTKYEWWIQRIKAAFSWYDVTRIDHFRGFDEYYSIPFGEKTAQRGEWKKGPGMELFSALKDALGELDIIAEDLGTLTDSVRKLLKDSQYPGMKVLQFAFDYTPENDYLPHNYEKNCVVYTGTHDNDTTVGWFNMRPASGKIFPLNYVERTEQESQNIHWDFIRLAMSSVANLCIIPMQDCLGLGGEARINTPSTLGLNWKWRLKKDEITDEITSKLRTLSGLYGR